MGYFDEMDTPRPPDIIGPMFFKWKYGQKRWHYLLRHLSGRVVAPCGVTAVEDESDMSASPPVQSSCLNCLKKLSSLPVGVFPDDLLVPIAEGEI